MINYVKTYLDRLLTYMPVAIFIFTIIFFMNTSFIVTDFKVDFGVNALDEFVDLYTFYFVRTIILAALVPLFDVVLSNDKLSYRTSLVSHYLLITITVGFLFYLPGESFVATLLTIGLCTIIYVVIRLVIYLREKSFIDDANNIFMKNEENS